MEMAEINIGNRIKFFRIQKGFSVNKLANLAGVSQSYLRDIELSKNNNIGVETLNYICWALDITLKDFFSEDDDSFFDTPLYQHILALSSTQRETLQSFLASITEKVK